MDFVIGDLLTIEGNKYMTLETLTHENNQYIFVNKVLNDEEVSDEYYIFKVLKNGVKLITDEDVINILIPKFQELLKKDIKELI